MGWERECDICVGCAAEGAPGNAPKSAKPPPPPEGVEPVNRICTLQYGCNDYEHSINRIVYCYLGIGR